MDYIEAITDGAVARAVGAHGLLLLSKVAAREDKAFYTRGVNLTDVDLAEMFNCDRKTIRRARQACIEAGLLHYEPGVRGRGSLYWVLSPTSESPDDSTPRIRGNKSPKSNEGLGGEFPPNGEPIRGTEGDTNPPNPGAFGGNLSPSGGYTYPLPMKPKTHVAKNGVSLKPQRHGKKETPRSLLGVTDAELRDTAALLSRIKALRSDGVLQSTEGDELNAIAAAERALAHGKRPAALWVVLVRGRDWAKLSDADVDAANRRRKQHQRDTTPAGGPASASVAHLAATFAPPQSASPEVYE